MAVYARRFLKHPSFRTYRMRMGKAVRVHPAGIAYWLRNATEETEVPSS
jgi:hypothetical protein